MFFCNKELATQAAPRETITLSALMKDDPRSYHPIIQMLELIHG
jgi:hypothetical protein